MTSSKGSITLTSEAFLQLVAGVVVFTAALLLVTKALGWW